MLNSLLKLLGKGGGSKPTQAPSGPPANINVTNVPHVWGTAVAQNTANQQGYTPQFRSLVQRANPSVDSFAAKIGAGGAYIPGLNQIHLNPNQLDPYTVTHEGLHAAFQAKTPQQQQAFAKVAAQATPNQQNLLNSLSQLGSSIYQGQRPLTEIHSYLPQLNAPSPTQAYYRQYFSNPDFYQGPRTRNLITDATGFNNSRPRPTLQFGVDRGDY